MTKLSPETLRLQILAAADPYKDLTGDFLLGSLVQPAHTFEQGTVSVAERRFEVWFNPIYGVTSHGLGTSNGSALVLVSRVREGTTWVPA